jgi:hypothetical protein
MLSRIVRIQLKNVLRNTLQLTPEEPSQRPTPISAPTIIWTAGQQRRVSGGMMQSEVSDQLCTGEGQLSSISHFSALIYLIIDLQVRFIQLSSSISSSSGELRFIQLSSSIASRTW